MSSSLKDAIEKAVLQHTPDHLRKRANPLTTDKWGRKQRQNVCAYIAPQCPEENMVVLVDETSLNTGKAGVVFATDGIYTMFCRDIGGVYFVGWLQYEEIKKVDMPGKKSDRLVLYYREKRFNVLYASEKYLEFLYHALNAAIEAFKVYAAEQGKIQDQYRCACMYDEGVFVPVDKAKALYWYEKAAEQDDTESQYQCAVRYYRGEGAAVDKEKAWLWAEKAAPGWHCEAELLLGRLSIEKGTVEDKERALEWLSRAEKHGQMEASALAQAVEFELDGIKLEKLEEAAGQGDADAQYQCAVMYQYGKGTAVNLQKAFYWYEQAAMQGHAKSQECCGDILYKKGKGAEPDIVKAFSWYKRAAGQNELFSMLQCGMMYDEGEGTEIDKEQALYWYERAAEEGKDPVIECICGERYDGGVGTEKDESKALCWYERAAGQGNVNAQFQCGRHYSNGYGTEVNKEKALYWYEKAAEQGDTAAQFNTGLFYSKGMGTEKDEKRALYWYEKAAGQGHVKAQYNCGRRYHKGIGTKEDVQRAADWLLKASAQGHEKAAKECEELREEAYQAGRMLYLLQDKRKYEAALYQLEAAARLGDARAQYYAAVMYDEGLGTEKDRKKAIYWCELAAKQDYLEAQIKAGDLRLQEGIYYSSAAYWYEEAAEKGSEYARFQCGLAYGYDENYEEALKWFEPLANEGDADAMYNCSVSYSHLKNAASAVFWRDLALKNGSQAAINDKKWRDQYG